MNRTGECGVGRQFLGGGPQIPHGREVNSPHGEDDLGVAECDDEVGEHWDE